MKRRKLDVSYLINGVLGALVAICGEYNNEVRNICRSSVARW